MGLGYIAQAAILPAFANASRNSKLAALVSGDSRKLKKLKKKYDVPLVYSYEDYDACLESGEIDAVFIALPNNMHCEYTVRAAEKGDPRPGSPILQVAVSRCPRACDRVR